MIYKYVIFLYLSSLLVSCTQLSYKTKKVNVIINKECQNSHINTKKKLSYMFFETTFSEDFLEVFLNNKKIFKDTISTDSRTGLAMVLNLGEKTEINKISFRINNSKLININKINCNYIFVVYLKDSVVDIKFNNKAFGYK